jgi:hypothetical protein
MSQTQRKRTSRQGAATGAHDKTKKSIIDDILQWTYEPKVNSKSSVCYMNEFEDLARTSKKRKESIQKDCFDVGNGEMSNYYSSYEKPTKFLKGVSSSTSSKRSRSLTPSITSLIDSESEYEPTTEEREKAERELRAADRRQHSGRPMILSRRLSYRLSDPLSPMYSPITVCKLSFSPEKHHRKYRNE